jgi:pyruvate,water dikinase
MISQPQLSPEQGATQVLDRGTFEALARRDDVPGALAAHELKFLIVGVDGPTPALFFMNTENFPFHFHFADRVLRLGLTNTEFNRRTYFRQDRSNLAGAIVAHDHFEPDGLYALGFWPTDPVRAGHIALAYDAIRDAMPFAAQALAYHPAGVTQEALQREDAAQLAELGVRVISTDALFGGVTYVPLNLGEGYGVLSVVAPDGGRPATIRDVAVFTALPNDLGHVAGVVSETPQTPLSHVNLKAKQNDTPNAYLKDAATDPRVAGLLGQVVRYEVTPETLSLTAATPEQVQAWLERIRPLHPQTPPRDLGVTEIVALDGLGHGSAATVGAKAANVAELRRLLPAGTVPAGYAIPFWFYDRFMRANDLYAAAAEIVRDPKSWTDPALLDERLGKLRRQIRRGDLPPELDAAIADLHARFAPGTPIRCRSSTNNEDLAGFNGAGLYDSHTHRPDEGPLSDTVRQVWSSLWTFRGTEEREFHRIDHLAAAMGVLVHPNFDDELANGVAVTKNPFDPDWPGFYINVQVGESLVTNPDPNAVPDELLVSRIGPNDEYETQYIRRSSLVPGGGGVMTPAQIAELVAALEQIQAHFRRLYDADDDPAFAMDVEFKTDADGSLVVKQARPWVD